MEKAEIIIQRGKRREYFYELCVKFFSVCDTRGYRLIVENPYASHHYLVENFPYRASFIDFDRTKRGDFYKKPTQYWFINCENTNRYTEQQQLHKKQIANGKSGIKAGICSEDRSMISPDYARNFICDLILGKTQPNIDPQLF